MNTIANNLTSIHQQILEFEKIYQRLPHSVLLLAVTKKQSIEQIQQAIHAGQIAFGENYLQEALPKMAYFNDEKLEWHFIGPLQTNKTKKIAEHFSWVHTVDSKKIAIRLSEQRPPHLPPLNICLQVNTSLEATKSGISIEEALPLAEFCLTLPRLRLRGLMTIPAFKKNLPEQRAELHPLKTLYDQLCGQGYDLDTLSMGMSNDLEAAVAEGTTLVRIGTAIFGSRLP